MMIGLGNLKNCWMGLNKRVKDWCSKTEMIFQVFERHSSCTHNGKEAVVSLTHIHWIFDHDNAAWMLDFARFIDGVRVLVRMWWNSWGGLLNSRLIAAGFCSAGACCP